MSNIKHYLIESKVIEKCTPYTDLAASSAFFDFWGIEDTANKT